MSNEVIIQKDITDQVSSRIKGLEEEGLKLPTNYNAANALKSAWFAIQKAQDRNRKPALEVATKESIANALLDMVVQGLSPAKTQCYFVVFGKELQLQRSYFGTQAVLKRLNNVKDIWAEVVHKGDVFKIGSNQGRTIVTEFEPDFANQDNEIIGAFAVIEKIDGERVYTVMTKKEIDKSWSKAKTKNVQTDFPQEMAKRTVINRAAKSFINTSDDSDLLTESIKRTTENEYDNSRKDVTPEKQTVALEQKLFSNKTIDEPIQKEAEPIVIPDDVQEEVTRVADVPGHPEIEQAHLVDKDDEEPVQEELLDVPNFGREEGVKDVSEFEDDDYPF
ncbi:RecT family recombinase [Enterococcus thailandicus]|uniref:recombinase RecT n=1 Tax=Enterococcus thailandicus TaxID=417368 RepID=UPI0032E44621